MIFQRYADPFRLLNGMLSAGRFADYVHELLQMHNEEQEDKTLWEFYLHKVHDKSYNDFKKSTGMMNKTAAPTLKEKADVVQQSKAMLNAFRPTGDGVNGNIQTSGDNSNR